ncbi:MAG: DUF5131 family protein, partial [Alphaproteobacteria bacterium]|nr:DUF5131 family protein [Alphaproteobacteria bacterium]
LAGGRLKNHPSRRGLTRPSTAGPVWNGKVRLNEQWLTAPLKWKRPRRIFVCAHGDLFHEAVPVQWLDRFHAVMALAPQHVFQVLTKRSTRMRDYYNDPDVEDHVKSAAASLSPAYGPTPGSLAFDMSFFFPLRHLCLGVSVEDRERSWRIQHLIDTPANLRFVSFEPLLEDVSSLDLHDIDWAIVGGESGPRARRMDPAWVHRLRDRCRDESIAFFFKQWGGLRPKSAGRLLDGVLHDAVPEPLDQAEGSWLIPLQHDGPGPAFVKRYGMIDLGWGERGDPSRATPDGMPPKPKDFAMMFSPRICYRPPVTLRPDAEIEVLQDFCSELYYVVLRRKPGVSEGPRSEKVLCNDGRWRQRRRVRLPGGQPA